MNGKYCLIRQPAGLGDIFFCQKIAQKLIEKQWSVIWPIIEPYYFIKDYINGYFPSVNDSFSFKQYYNEKKMILDKDLFLFIPLQDADRIHLNSGLMESKYKMVNLKFDDWAEYFNFNRLKDREERVWFYFNLKTGEKYNVVNSNYGSSPNTLKINNIKINNNYRIIELNSLGFDNIFDWCKILENAEEIHTVNTSWCYIIEKLNIKAKLFMYNRGNQLNFNYLKGIFKQNWTYIN